MTAFRFLRFAVVFAILFASAAALAQAPRVLVVDAHPDDESAYAATIYKITHDLHGIVDLAVITNGEAGYKYSTLAESYYHLKLTDEKVGRKYLPGIREKELNAAGKVIGLHQIIYFHQKDNHYTQNQHEVIDDTSHVWNLPAVRKKLSVLLAKGHYDFVFTLLPTDSTHGHHKGATLLALEAVNKMPVSKRPVILAGSVSRKGAAIAQFTGLAGYPLTAFASGSPSYSFDQGMSFGFRYALNYTTVVNWEIAEHKSQGTMYMNHEPMLEEFWYYDMNGSGGRAKTQALFDKLAENFYPEVTYPGIK